MVICRLGDPVETGVRSSLLFLPIMRSHVLRLERIEVIVILLIENLKSVTLSLLLESQMQKALLVGGSILDYTVNRIRKFNDLSDVYSIPFVKLH